MENTPVRRVARGSGVGATPGPPSIPPPMTPPVMDGKIDWNQIEVANGLPSQTSLPSSAVHRASHGATGLRPVISTSSDSVTGDWIHSTSKFDETRGVSALTPVAHPPSHLEAPVFVRSVNELKATMSHRDVLSSVRGPPVKPGGGPSPSTSSALPSQQITGSKREISPENGQNRGSLLGATLSAPDGHAPLTRSVSKTPDPLLGPSISAKSSRRSSNGTSRTEISSMPDVEDLDVRLAISEPEPVIVADVVVPPTVHDRFAKPAPSVDEEAAGTAADQADCVRSLLEGYHLAVFGYGSRVSKPKLVRMLDHSMGPQLVWQDSLCGCIPSTTRLDLYEVEHVCHGRLSRPHPSDVEDDDAQDEALSMSIQTSSRTFELKLSSTLERNVLAHCITKIINRFAEQYQATQNSHYAFKMTMDEFLLPPQDPAPVVPSEVTGRPTVSKAPPVIQQPVIQAVQPTATTSPDAGVSQAPPPFVALSQGPLLSSARGGKAARTPPESPKLPASQHNRLADLIPERQSLQNDGPRLLPRARSDFSEAPSDDGGEGKSEASIDLTMDDLNDSGTGGHPGIRDSVSPNSYEELRDIESSSMAAAVPVPLSLPAFRGSESEEAGGGRGFDNTPSSTLPILSQPSPDESKPTSRSSTVQRGQGIRAITSGVVKGGGLKDHDVVSPPSQRSANATGTSVQPSPTTPSVVITGSAQGSIDTPSGSGKRSSTVLASGWLSKPGPHPAPLFCVLTAKHLKCYSSQEDSSNGATAAMSFPLEGVHFTAASADYSLTLTRGDAELDGVVRCLHENAL